MWKRMMMIHALIFVLVIAQLAKVVSASTNQQVAAFVPVSWRNGKNGIMAESCGVMRQIQQQQRKLQWRNNNTPNTKCVSPSSLIKRNAIMDIVGTSPEPIHAAFTVATFGPQPFWLLLILLPKSEITKKIMESMDIVILFALVHFFIVSASIVQPGATAPLMEFNDVFDPSGDPQAAFMNMVTNYPNFVAEEWSHVLTWDLFVGRWIWLDGLRRGIFTSHSVLFCNLIGPPGLLMHWVTCLLTGKGFIDNEVPTTDGGEAV